MSRSSVVAFLAVCVALVLQTSALPHLAFEGVVPDLVLLVVVAAGITGGAQTGMVLGFVGGLLLDLAPPADHLAGRWALALLVVGYVAGRVRADLTLDRPSVPATLLTVAGCSFLGTSLFALTGVLLGDGTTSVPDLLHVVAIGVVYDVVATPFVVPWLARLLVGVEPERIYA